MKSKRIFYLLFTILSISISFMVSSSKAVDARDIAKKAFPSVVMLLMKDSAGQPLSLGSGFLVKDGIVATNLHVVAGSVKGYAKFIGQKKKYDILGYVAIDEKSDMVLLKIKDANAPVLSLGDSSKVAIGDEIFVIGNPQGLEGTFSKGIVSAIRTIRQDSLLQITAPISPGSSGGPVLDEQGKVIGVAVATFKGGQNLNFAIPSSYLSDLLASMKPLKPLAKQNDAPKKTKSILSDLGGRSTEGLICRQFLWNYPPVRLMNLVRSVSGSYSFTIQNNIEEPVMGVLCLVIFYDSENQPIDTDIVTYKSIIPPKLAKRLSSVVDTSIPELTTHGGENKPHTKVEFRIMDFTFVEESEEGL